MATHSSILAWKIPWTEEPGRLQSMGSQRVTTEASEHHTHASPIFSFLWFSFDFHISSCTIITAAAAKSL